MSSKSIVGYASVALSSGHSESFEYSILEEQLNDISIGSSVKVPLRGAEYSGIVLALYQKPRYKNVRPIIDVLKKEPLLSKELFDLAAWIAKYYHCPIAKALKLFFPKSVRSDMGHKEQLVITRNLRKEELILWCQENRGKKKKQCVILDEMLKVNKEILLTELLEKTGSSRSTVMLLVKQNILCQAKTIIDRNPLKSAEFFISKPKVLNDEQQVAYNQICSALGTFKTFLLKGVTGSGKTEVYMQCIQKTLDMGKSSIMLVPEIALTTQTIEKFKSRFKDKIAILHHRLSQGEKYDQWHQIQKGEAQIVIGARSAIFAPVKNLGLVIVDEEHESSYKQNEEGPCYHARDIAVVRAKMNSATVILGSATPSLESYTNTQRGKYQLIELKNRATKNHLPKVKLIDMKIEFEKNGGYTLFSSELLTKIEDRYKKGEQTLLFLNRRGYHTSLICLECGEVSKCPSCDIALTYHLKSDCLACHLCDYTISSYKNCPKCKTQTLKFKGMGTEKVEVQLKKIFPEIKTLRMDRDTTKHVGSYEKLYYSFKNHKADVLIGTQMIAKGLDFPNVSLVGVLNCDSQLNIPDFKASETTFQLLTQVAGRAGRGEALGEVLVQTFNTSNEILKFAKEQDFESFYQHEVKSRELFTYPPFVHLIKLCFKGKSEDLTFNYAKRFYAYLKKNTHTQCEIYEPLASGYAKVKEFYRFQILIKTHHVYGLNEAIYKSLYSVKKPSNIRVLIDVDPLSTFF